MLPSWCCYIICLGGETETLYQTNQQQKLYFFTFSKNLEVVIKIKIDKLIWFATDETFFGTN